MDDGTTPRVFSAIRRGIEKVDDGIEHVVVVDEYAQIITDACERTPLLMNWSKLQKCIGPATYSGVIGIRKVNRQTESVSKRKDPRRNKRKVTQDVTECS